MDCNRKKLDFQYCRLHTVISFFFYFQFDWAAEHIPKNQVFLRSKVTIKTMLGITKNGAETVTLLQQHVVDFSESSFFGKVSTPEIIIMYFNAA